MITNTYPGFSRIAKIAYEYRQAHFEVSVVKDAKMGLKDDGYDSEEWGNEEA